MKLTPPPVASISIHWLAGCVHGVCILFGTGRPQVSHRSVISLGIKSGSHDPFGFRHDAVAIGDSVDALPLASTRANGKRLLTPDEARAMLRIVLLPSDNRAVRMLQLPAADVRGHVSNTIDCLSAEDARMVIKHILGCERMNQPQRSVGAEGLAADGDLAVANPGEREGRDGAGLGVGGAKAGGQPLGGNRAIDDPQGHQLIDETLDAAAIGRVRQAQIQVGAVGTGDVVHVARLQMDITLRVDAGARAHGDE